MTVGSSPVVVFGDPPELFGAHMKVVKVAMAKLLRWAINRVCGAHIKVV